VRTGLQTKNETHIGATLGFINLIASKKKNEKKNESPGCISSFLIISVFKH